MSTSSERLCVLHSPISTQAREKCRRLFHVIQVLLAKLLQDFIFFAARKLDVHRYENRKHHECHQGRPLKQKAEHDYTKAHVLRMTHVSIGTCRRQRVRALGSEKHLPSRG